MAEFKTLLNTSNEAKENTGINTQLTKIVHNRDLQEQRL